MDDLELKQLLTGKQIELLDNEDQDAAHGLRLLVIDAATNSVGVLAIEPVQLAIPDEPALDYSWQWVREPVMPHFEECDYSILTRTGPDYDRGEVPFLI